MGFRPRRSTESAAKLITDLVQATWDLKGTASLLQLDLSGAFDTVNHSFLLATLRSLGFKEGLVKWFTSYLSDRTASLSFDSQKSDLKIVRAGVP